ncbi:MAG: tyrosine--tRNA ligase [Candidatus Kerfeldbacteria bacterium]|nr:tyrosine--tRNA ligase [Candidatus Kerfeldbacteria bacterium]
MMLEDLLTRGVAGIIPKDIFTKKLQTGERMRLYLGVDPTGPVIHIGHAVILRKMRQLQDLGHEIILLIGDFTARIGDPTDRSAARTTLTHEEVLANAATYKEQAAKILDFSDSASNPARLEFNAKWLDKLRFSDVIELSARFTVQQMLERDMFEKRMQEGKPIHVHEFLYPIMQGYDSVAMDVDAEFGGNDQLFNMLTGRSLQQMMNKKEKVVVTFELLPGLDGRKMSKSFGNVIGVDDSPNDMFGKVMSLKDELIPEYFWLCTNSSVQDVQGVKHALSKGENPRDLKMCLARKIIALYHSVEAANAAEKEFIQVFQQKGAPTDIPVYHLAVEDVSIVDVIVRAGLAVSKAETRRLIEQGGVKLNGKKVNDAHTALAFADGDTVQVGKRKFITLRK